MGLAERRAIEQFRTEEYPAWKERIDAAAGFDVPVEVAWPEFGNDGLAAHLKEYIVKVYFTPLVDALAAVTIDDLGRDALREGLRQIVVTNTGEHYSTSGFTFVDGVLTVDHRPTSNVDATGERAKGL